MTATLTCANPACKRRFVPDSEHRYGAACCAMCAVKLTKIPRTIASPQHYAKAVIVVHGAPISRRHGVDNRKRSDE